MNRSLPRARWIALFTIVAISFVSGGWLLRPAPAAEGGIYQQARLFEHVVAAINRHYIDSLGEGDLYQRAATALVGSLQDPYAELLIKEEYREYRRQMTGTEVDFDLNDGPTESGLDRKGREISSSPATRCISIDGRNTTGWSTKRIEEALREGRGADGHRHRPASGLGPSGRAPPDPDRRARAGGILGRAAGRRRRLRRPPPDERGRGGRASRRGGPSRGRGDALAGAGPALESWGPHSGGSRSRRPVPPSRVTPLPSREDGRRATRRPISPRTPATGVTFAWPCW